MPNIPSSFNRSTEESVQFDNPVSEGSLSAMGGAINGLLDTLLPIGTIVDSMLTEAQFQTQLGNPSPATWVLADGRSVVGSTYNVITGFSTIPDLRGIFRRAKNNGRSDGDQNPDGDLALGTYSADKFASHRHGIEATFLPEIGGPIVHDDGSEFRVDNKDFTAFEGGNETAPKNVTINTFIRIN